MIRHQNALHMGFKLWVLCSGILRGLLEFIALQRSRFRTR